MQGKDLQEDTIVAIATPPGEGGIGILRMSGPRAPEALATLYRGKVPTTQFQSHRLYSGQFLHPKTGEVLDEGLAVWMQAPRSYTGEQVVELQVHGGPLLLNEILQVLLDLGLRPAEPGEFTRRAFLNGKLDLLQAEAVGEMIHAQSEAALKNARGQLAGRISEQVQGMRDRIIDLMARVEAAIDFPEEDIEILSPQETGEQIRELRLGLETWLERFDLGRLIREGVKLALVGRPNVGKSSLLNRLVGEDKAIVHHQPGTTRDVVEGMSQIGGLRFQIFDTAGIREGEGEVEREGIHRSKRAAARADLTLWVVDGSKTLTTEDRQILGSLNGPIRVVANKVDLPPAVETFPPDWNLPAGLRDQPWLKVSAQTGAGLEELQAALVQAVGLNGLGQNDAAYLNNARHREALRNALDALDRAQEALKKSLPPECLADDLRASANALESLLGRVSTEEVLGKIFSEFCIGK